MVGVVKWFKEVNALPSPRHLDTLCDSHVLAIGAAGEDIVISSPDGVLPSVPNPADIVRCPGGVALNVAVNLAKLRQPVRLIAAIGVDMAGDRLAQHIQKYGLDISSVLRVSNRPTDIYVAMVNLQGERLSAFFRMGCAQEITPEMLVEKDQLFKKSSLVFIDANLPRNTMQTAISLAKQAGVPIIADPAAATLAVKLRPHLADLSMLVVNQPEAETLLGRAANAANDNGIEEIVKQIVSEGAGKVVMCLPKSGWICATNKGHRKYSTNNARITDPTGGRDAMTAAIIYALRREIPLIDAIRLGISATMLTQSFRGTVYPGLTLERIIDHLVI
jgi:pseudouridine kinase